MTFTIACIEDKIFCIIRKDALTETGNMFKKFPIEVHGFLKEMGTSYDDSMIAFEYISDEAFREFDELEAQVKTTVWGTQKCQIDYKDVVVNGHSDH